MMFLPHKIAELSTTYTYSTKTTVRNLQQQVHIYTLVSIWQGNCSDLFEGAAGPGKPKRTKHLNGCTSITSCRFCFVQIELGYGGFLASYGQQLCWTSRRFIACVCDGNEQMCKGARKTTHHPVKVHAYLLVDFIDSAKAWLKQISRNPTSDSSKCINKPKVAENQAPAGASVAGTSLCHHYLTTAVNKWSLRLAAR